MKFRSWPRELHRRLQDNVLRVVRPKGPHERLVEDNPWNLDADRLALHLLLFAAELVLRDLLIERVDQALHVLVEDPEVIHADDDAAANMDDVSGRPHHPGLEGRRANEVPDVRALRDAAEIEGVVLYRDDGSASGGL